MCGYSDTKVDRFVWRSERNRQTCCELRTFKLMTLNTLGLLGVDKNKIMTLLSQGRIGRSVAKIVAQSGAEVNYKKRRENTSCLGQIINDRPAAAQRFSAML